MSSKIISKGVGNLGTTGIKKIGMNKQEEKNKTLKECLNLFKGRQDLLEEEENKITKEKLICPQTKITVNKIATTGLYDTGSQVTCISESFYKDYEKNFKECPMIPVSGAQVIGATGKQATKISLQVYVEIKIGELSINWPVLIIPKLIRECILGIDILKELKTKIDIDKEEIYLSYKGKEEIMGCEISLVNQKRCVHRELSGGQEINKQEEIFDKQKKTDETSD